MNGATTGFLYDGVQAIAELKGAALETVYHTGLEMDEVLARYGASGNRTLLTDALMSVIAQANDDQTIGNFYAYSPYGQAITLGPDEGNPLQYTGRENDGTGLYYYRARYYDPALKRFIAEDPIGIDGDINLYAYVAGDPVSYIDPLGLEIPDPNRVIPGGPWTPAPGQRQGAFYGPPQPSGARVMCQWVPPYGKGGPPGSTGYWKTKYPGVPGWQYWTQQEQLTTPGKVHKIPIPKGGRGGTE